MDAEDFEFEELVVAEAVGLAFHGLDLGVGAFQGAGGDAGSRSRPGCPPGVLRACRRTAAACGCRRPRRGRIQSSQERGAPSRLLGLLPDLPQVFLQVVGHGQRLVQVARPPAGVRASLRSSSRFSGFFSSSQRVPLSTGVRASLGGLAIQLAAEGR